MKSFLILLVLSAACVYSTLGEGSIVTCLSDGAMWMHDPKATAVFSSYTAAMNSCIPIADLEHQKSINVDCPAPASMRDACPQLKGRMCTLKARLAVTTHVKTVEARISTDACLPKSCADVAEDLATMAKNSICYSQSAPMDGTISACEFEIDCTEASLALIIGLSVGGGVLILAAVVGLIVFFVKRRQSDDFTHTTSGFVPLSQQPEDADDEEGNGLTPTN